MLDEIETLYANNVNDAAGRQRRPSLHLPRHVHADRDCVVGHRLCQGPVPRRLHQGHRDDALDQEDCQRVLGTHKTTMLSRSDPRFVSKFCLHPNVVQTFMILWMLHRLTSFCQTLP